MPDASPTGFPNPTATPAWGSMIDTLNTDASINTSGLITAGVFIAAVLCFMIGVSQMSRAPKMSYAKLGTEGAAMGSGMFWVGLGLLGTVAVLIRLFGAGVTSVVTG